MGFSQATVSRAINRFVLIMATKVDQFVKFPTTEEELRQVTLDFYSVAKFPGVVSLIDGTHVEILNPGQSAQDYRCRKGYPSLNTQVCCDAKVVTFL